MRRRALMATPAKKDIISKYLTFTALEDGMQVSLSVNPCEYSLDGGVTWTALAAGTKSPAVGKGDSINFKGNITPVYGSGCGTFSVVGANCDVSGNVMSLIHGENAEGVTSLTAKGAFMRLLQNCKTVISAKNLLLPATTLSAYCYYFMFYNCSNLIYPPKMVKLIKTAESSLGSMFRDCSKLTTQMQIRAGANVGMGDSCCSFMYNGCVSLSGVVKIPGSFGTSSKSACMSMFEGCKNIDGAEITSTSLATDCLKYCFRNCSNLKLIKTKFTGWSSSNATDWVSGVSSTGVFVRRPGSFSWVTGASGIPNGWEVREEEW